jgi:hypothetical protein
MRRNKLENRRQASRRPQRRLAVESLESRSLLAADCFHNFMMPEDADGSGDVSPLDALAIINGLNTARFGVEGESAATNRAVKMMDVDADGNLSPLDALVVINYLNESSAGNPARPSHIDVERRMAWLEQSLATGRLPSSYTVHEAFEALATLRAGGRPEMGQAWIDGRLRELKPSTDSEQSGRADLSPSDRGDSDRGDSDRGASGGSVVGQPGASPGESRPGGREDVPGDDPAQQRDQRRWIATILDRLAAIGIDTATLTEVRASLVTLLRSVEGSSSNDSVRQQLHVLLTELGIDPSKIFPAREVEHTRAWFDGLRTRLMAAGVDEAVIATLAAEIRGAVVEGVPMSLAQIRARLIELGVDLIALFPKTLSTDRPGRSPMQEFPTPEPPALPPTTLSERSQPELAHAELVEGLVRRLRMAGVGTEIVETLLGELRASFAEGAALTLGQIRARLIELGVDVRRILPEPPAPNSDSGASVGSSGADSVPGGFPVELLNRIDLRRFLPLLAQRGVSTDQINIILAEMRRAEANGRPLSVPEIVIRLKQLGVPIDRWMSPMA